MHLVGYLHLCLLFNCTVCLLITPMDRQDSRDFLLDLDRITSLIRDDYVDCDDHDDEGDNDEKDDDDDDAGILIISTLYTFPFPSYICVRF